MRARGPKVPSWYSIVENWLLAEMRASAHGSATDSWNITHLAKHAEFALGIKKSKRSWERFLGGLPFLSVVTSLSDIRDDSDRPAKALIIRQLIKEAQLARRPVRFLAIHDLEDFRVVVTSTTKGKKTWLAINNKVNQSTVYEKFLIKILEEDALLIPCGRAVYFLRDLQHHANARPVIGGLKGETSGWFKSLIAFSEQVTALRGVDVRDPKNTLDTPTITKKSTAETSSTSTSQKSQLNKKLNASMNTMQMTHLDRLEAESIHIMREVMAYAENPVMLYSIGKDSSVMLHLARKAFYPSVPPFPLLHVDTRWKFRDMYEFREKAAQESGMELLVHINPDGIKKNINPFDHGSALHTNIMKTEGLKQALDLHGFDVAFGGARRDEEKSRAKERIFSFRNQSHSWDPKSQRPELWNLYNCRKNPGESIRVFPLSNWTELDIWQYIYRESIPIVPLYFAFQRPVVERGGMLIMVDDDRMQLLPGEKIMPRMVRFRTLGCYPLTGAIESTATDLPGIVLELLQSTTSERQGRTIDTDSSSSMEKKKQEGYF